MLEDLIRAYAFQQALVELADASGGMLVLTIDTKKRLVQVGDAPENLAGESWLGSDMLGAAYKASLRHVGKKMAKGF